MMLAYTTMSTKIKKVTMPQMAQGWRRQECHFCAVLDLQDRVGSMGDKVTFFNEGIDVFEDKEVVVAMAEDGTWT
jgi:hypothetical protein